MKISSFIVLSSLLVASGNAHALCLSNIWGGSCEAKKPEVKVPMKKVRTPRGYRYKPDMEKLREAQERQALKKRFQFVQQPVPTAKVVKQEAKPAAVIKSEQIITALTLEKINGGDNTAPAAHKPNLRRKRCGIHDHFRRTRGCSSRPVEGGSATASAASELVKFKAEAVKSATEKGTVFTITRMIDGDPVMLSALPGMKPDQVYIQKGGTLIPPTSASELREQMRRARLAKNTTGQPPVQVAPPKRELKKKIVKNEKEKLKTLDRRPAVVKQDKPRVPAFETEIQPPVREQREPRRLARNEGKRCHKPYWDEYGRAVFENCQKYDSKNDPLMKFFKSVGNTTVDLGQQLVSGTKQLASDIASGTQQLGKDIVTGTERTWQYKKRETGKAWGYTKRAAKDFANSGADHETPWVKAAFTAD